MKQKRAWAVLLIGTLLTGVAACAKKKSDEQAGSAPVELAMPASAAPTEPSAPAANEPVTATVGGTPADGLLRGGDAGKADRNRRKIIRTGEIALVVDDYHRARQAIDRLVSGAGGFIASAEVARTEGSVAAATLVIRVPQGEIDAAVAALSKLGTLERESIRAEDVSETYHDLAARLRNAKALEVRMVELAAKAGGVKDLLEVEREIGRVRETVEVMEGQLRGLDDRTSLATLSISLRTRSLYVPIEQPGLGDKIDRAFSASLDALADAGEALLLFSVSALPWLLPVAGAALLVRRRFRRRSP
jgi:hypothetical protein